MEGEERREETGVLCDNGMATAGTGGISLAKEPLLQQVMNVPIHDGNRMQEEIMPRNH